MQNAAEIQAKAQAVMPSGLRDPVSLRLMEREMDLPVGADREGRIMARALRNAVEGHTDDPEQYARWKRLGLI